MREALPGLAVAVVLLLAGCLSSDAPRPQAASAGPDDQAAQETPAALGEPTPASSAAPDPPAVDDPAPSAPPVDPAPDPPRPPPPLDPWARQCPPTPAPEQATARVPVLAQRCVAPASFVLDGRDLGFAEEADTAGVRPGMNVGGCSTSYMLADDEGDLYLVQSAHCVYAPSDLTEEGTFCTRLYDELGSEQPIEGFEEPGTLAWVSGLHMTQYASTAAECDSWDLAFIRLPRALHGRAHPAIRHIGGPTGLVDPLAISAGDDMVGYGNSDDRGFVVEAATGDDHGNAPVWPTVNVFKGYFAGNVLDDVLCPTSGVAVSDLCWDTDPYYHGTVGYVRYAPPKITGDSGSADLLADGKALGVTSAINFATGLDATSFLYDTLLRIWLDTGVRYRLVSWHEWSPDTLEA